MAVLLRGRGWKVCTSTVGGILTASASGGCEVVELSLEVAALNQELLAWEHTSNTIRPHQALAYLAPYQFVTQWQDQRKEAMCH